MVEEPAKVGKLSAIPRIVVAGDVCVDWLSIVVDPAASDVPPKSVGKLARRQSPSRKPMNWQLIGGRHMYARSGGAWLTADFVEAAVGKTARVSQPGRGAGVGKCSSGEDYPLDADARSSAA
jgi:hypothetical protein